VLIAAKSQLAFLMYVIIKSCNHDALIAIQRHISLKSFQFHFFDVVLSSYGNENGYAYHVSSTERV
jgi:hypothetical protein